MIKKFLSILSMATAIFSVVSCEGLLDVIGGELSGSQTEFTVTPSTVSIKPEGGEANIAFTAPEVWSATSSEDWITINPAAGKSGENIVTITALPNQTGVDRSAKVTVESGGVKVNVTVNQASISGDTPPDPPQGEPLWSIIGTVCGSNWDVDFDMDFDGTTWKNTIYIAEGEEFKIRNNHDWGDNRGWGQYNPIDPEVDAVPDGANITLPHSGYWTVIYSPETEKLSFEHNLTAGKWEYFLNPETGEPAVITFIQNFWGEKATGYIKYYEVYSGVRICRTETTGHVYNGEAYNGNGFWGSAENAGEDEWTFIWYTDSNLIQLPLQFTGYHNPSYEADVWVYDGYATEKYLRGNTELPTWLEAATAEQYVSGYYDNNGGFYFYVLWYYMSGIGGYKQDTYDIIGEAEGFDRHDYTMECSSAFTRGGYTPVRVIAGRDIVTLKYVLVDGQLDEETAQAKANAIIDGSQESTLFKDFVYNEGTLKNVADFNFTAARSGYQTLVAVGYDAYGQDYWWLYWYFPVYVFDASRTWTSLGTGKYTDGYFSSLFNSIEPTTWEVEVQQCNEDPTVYKMVYPYDSKFSYNKDGDWLTDKSYDIEINVPDNEHVYILPQDTGVYWGDYGLFGVLSDAAYDIAKGSTLNEAIAAGDSFGTLVDGVITFPTKGLLMILDEYNYGALYYGNSNDAFKLVLPGYEDTTTTTGGTTSNVGKKFLKSGWSVLRREDPSHGGNNFTRKSHKDRNSSID